MNLKLILIYQTKKFEIKDNKNLISNELIQKLINEIKMMISITFITEFL